MKRLLAFALSLGLAAVAGGAAPAVAQSSDDQVEMQIGQQEYQALQQKGEIISSSPYYSTPQPDRPADQARRRPAILPSVPVHPRARDQPERVRRPGRKRLRDRLADEVRAEPRRARRRALPRDLARHPPRRPAPLPEAAEDRDRVHDRRHPGQHRDRRPRARARSTPWRTSASRCSRRTTRATSRPPPTARAPQTCAAAGSNPWGMVWLFQQFEKADTGGQMEMLSDHPTDQHRIDDLKRRVRRQPGAVRPLPVEHRVRDAAGPVAARHDGVGRDGAHRVPPRREEAQGDVPAGVRLQVLTS